MAIDRLGSLRASTAGLALAASGRLRRALGLDDAGRLAVHRIREVRGFRYLALRSKLVGKNSRLDVHGDHLGDRCLLLVTRTRG